QIASLSQAPPHAAGGRALRRFQRQALGDANLSAGEERDSRERLVAPPDLRTATRTYCRGSDTELPLSRGMFCHARHDRRQRYALWRFDQEIRAPDHGVNGTVN